ncbi:MAG TPA: pyridoxamine 5'-phosphate oxidase family protein [Verrucomicrobiae bacterium]|jgi:uncharacterized protein YhbP (UPF0306 family)|nr:pyridoxamine 5'-phosphate oxidase family protein [Verrucomicrobiae bacterium]
MQIEELIRDYLPQVKIMQLATSVNDQPWACTIHYYSDDSLNLYWISTVARNHSQHIKQNPKVSATILVHENTPEEKYVIGISIAGTAELIGQKVEEQIGASYVQKLGRDPSLISDIASGVNPHKFYRLKPSKIVLFDSKNFSDNPRQEWDLNN